MKGMANKILTALIIFTLIVSSSGLAFAEEAKGEEGQTPQGAPKVEAVSNEDAVAPNNDYYDGFVIEEYLAGATSFNETISVIDINSVNDSFDVEVWEDDYFGYSELVSLKKGTLSGTASLWGDGEEYYCGTYFGLYRDAAMTDIIAEDFVDESQEEGMSYSFEVPEDGEYYLGFYAYDDYSDAENITLYIELRNILSEDTEVTPVYTLDKGELVLYENESEKLNISVVPVNYGLNGLNWSSDNPAVATVDTAGNVSAISPGTANITASVNGQNFTCRVEVRPMGLVESAVTVYVDKTKTLKVRGGTGNTTWSTSKKSVATVTSKGVVKGKKPGTATITGKKNGQKFKCKVTVKWAPETGTVSTRSYVVPVGDYEENEEEIVLKGKTTVTYTVTNTSPDLDYWGDDMVSFYISDATDPDDVYDKYDHYLSPGETVTNTVTLKAGTYQFRYYIDNGGIIDIKMTTKPQLSKTSMTVAKGSTRTLKTVAVANKGTWYSSNKKIATVTSSGKVKGKKNGTCYIKYKMRNGKILKCKVTVRNPVTFVVEGVNNEAIFNDCYIRFINNTGKKVKYIKFNIRQYNKVGKRLSSPYSWYYMDDDIEPYGSIEQYWWVNDSARKCKVSITKVYFTNGTTWRP